MARARLAGATWLVICTVASASAQAPVAPPALRVYLVRHAQAWKNVPRSERPPGMTREQLDALTPEGREAAERIGRTLAGAGVARVLTSPARRARQTADGIARGLGLEEAPVVSDALRPLDAGRDPRAADSAWRARNWSAGRDPRPEGGESLEDGLTRAERAVEELAAGQPEGAVVLVTHGEIAAALLTRAHGMRLLPGYFDAFPPEGSVRELEVEAGGVWRLVGARRP